MRPAHAAPHGEVGGVGVGGGGEGLGGGGGGGVGLGGGLRGAGPWSTRWYTIPVLHV